MKQLLFALIALTLPAMMVANNEDEGPKSSHSVDVQNSSVQWKGYKVTGEHSGTISISSGELEMNGGKLTGGVFVIDMTSIAVTDLTGDMKGKLEGHLKSDDFFGVNNFPTAKLEITKVKAKGDKYHVVADLTIKDITNPVEFEVTIKDHDDGKKAMAEIQVDRSKYDVRYGSNSFFDNLGDKAIYDNFDLTINLMISNEAS